MAEELKACAECEAPEGYVSGERFMAEHERVRELRAEIAALRAQAASQRGEAVGPACWQYKVYEERQFYPTDPRKQDFWSALDGIAHSAEPLYTHPAGQVAEGVVVSRELLERLTRPGEVLGDLRFWQAREELRALLAKSEGG